MTKTSETSQKEVVQTDQNSPAKLLQIAIESKADITQLEKLIELQERYEKNIAEKEFNVAMSRFQGECPEIKKDKKVLDKYGKLRYWYATIGSITKQIKKPLSDNGLFFDFQSQTTTDTLTSICTVTHFKGFSKSSQFTIPIGKEDFMTDVQKYGGRDSFAKRYALCNVLGITTADEDTDGKAPEEEKESDIEKDLKELLELKKTSITETEYKRGKEVIKKKEKNSYEKLKTFLQNK